MRLLLFIPAFILFLANIPFEIEMKMDKPTCKMMKADENHCEKGMANGVQKCHKDAEPNKSCHKPANSKDNQNENSCNAPTGLTCVCVYCFAYTAPVSTFTTIDFNIVTPQITLTGFIHSIWEDPQLSPPWQPPDIKKMA